MKRWNSGSWLWWGVVSSGLLGCQNQAPPANPPPTRTAPSISQPEMKPAPGGDVNLSAEPAKEPDAPPVAAVRAVLEGMDDGRLEALADFLPESYQQDIASFVRFLGDKTPDDAWIHWQSLADKAATLCRNKPETVVLLAGQVPATDNAELDDRVSTALDLIANPATWDRGRWTTFDLRPFLKDSGSTLLRAWQAISPPHAALSAQTKIRLVSQEGDAAVLEFRTPVDPEPRSVEFVQIEGKWIPKTIANGWETTIRAARTQLEAMEETRFAQLMERLTQLLAPIDSTLDQMMRSTRTEELQLGGWQLQSLLLQGVRSLQETGPPPRVEIRVAGELSDAALTDLLNQLVAVSDNPDAAEYVTLPIGTGTIIQLTPVRNLDDFAARLTFVTVKSQDAGKRMVEVELTNTPKPRGRGPAASE